MMSFLLAFLLSMTPSLDGPSTSQNPPSAVVETASSFSTGQEVVQAVRGDVQAGRYASFFQEMEQSYEAAKKENQLEGLIEIRKSAGAPNEQFLLEYNQIQSQKNKALLSLVASDDKTVLADKVRSATTPLTAEETAALDRLAPLRVQAPGTGANSDVNQLIDIDLKSAYKSIHLDSLVAGGQSIPDLREKHLALEMERMDQMSQAALKFQDKELKQSVEVASRHFDTRLAKHYDQSDLQALAKGKIKPSSITEEKIASILLHAQDQVAKLHVSWMNKTKSSS
jgi:hypothetical protein